MGCIYIYPNWCPLTLNSVYEILALFSTLIFIPLTPFAHKLPQYLNALVAVVFVVLLAATWTASPFTQKWPFRVYFQQFVELSSASTALTVNRSLAHPLRPFDVMRTETTLTGLKGYVDRYVTPGIPSSWNSNVSCDPQGLRPDLMTCRWATDLLPVPTPNASLASSSHFTSVQWLDVEVTRLNASRALIAVRGENTRGCRLYFDRPINFVYVHQRAVRHPQPSPVEKMRLQGGYDMSAEGVSEVRLWSRTWGRQFVVEVGWDADGEKSAREEAKFSGRAACEYAEYASGLGGSESGRIPAFEEVKQFLPLWALPTKANDGLVEVFTTFVV